MDGSPSSLITLGLGTGTFSGSPGLVVTLGLGIAAVSGATLVDTWSKVVRLKSKNKGRIKL